MAQSITIKSDQVTTVPLIFENSSNVIVSPTAGDVFTATPGSPSVGATIVGVGTIAGPSVALTPYVRAGGPYPVTISDTAGLPVITLNVTVITDPASATQWSLNVGSPTTAPQPIPTNPGP